MRKNNQIKKMEGNGGRRIQPPNITSISTNDLHPAFCFRYIQPNYCLKCCAKNAQILFVKKLEELGQLTWNQIQSSSKKANGHEKINIGSIRVSLPPNTPDDRDFLSFRLGGGKNSVFLGYRKDKIFYVVYIDPNGQVYSHGS